MLGIQSLIVISILLVIALIWLKSQPEHFRGSSGSSGRGSSGSSGSFGRGSFGSFGHGLPSRGSSVGHWSHGRGSLGHGSLGRGSLGHGLGRGSIHHTRGDFNRRYNLGSSSNWAWNGGWGWWPWPGWRPTWWTDWWPGYYDDYGCYSRAMAKCLSLGSPTASCLQMAYNNC